MCQSQVSFSVEIKIHMIDDDDGGVCRACRTSIAELENDRSKHRISASRTELIVKVAIDTSFLTSQSFLKNLKCCIYCRSFI